MTFGEKIRILRRERKLSLRRLADQCGMNFTYLSKIENGKLDFGDHPSARAILRLAAGLEADPDELLLMAGKVPESIRKRVMERPDAFRTIAGLDDHALDMIIKYISRYT